MGFYFIYWLRTLFWLHSVPYVYLDVMWNSPNFISRQLWNKDNFETVLTLFNENFISVLLFMYLFFNTLV